MALVVDWKTITIDVPSAIWAVGCLLACFLIHCVSVAVITGYRTPPRRWDRLGLPCWPIPPDAHRLPQGEIRPTAKDVIDRTDPNTTLRHYTTALEKETLKLGKDHHASVLFIGTIRYPKDGLSISPTFLTKRLHIACGFGYAECEPLSFPQRVSSSEELYVLDEKLLFWMFTLQDVLQRKSKGGLFLWAGHVYKIPESFWPTVQGMQDDLERWYKQEEEAGKSKSSVVSAPSNTATTPKDHKDHKADV